jgi:hypothetical protein
VGRFTNVSRARAWAAADEQSTGVAGIGPHHAPRQHDPS